MNKNPGPLFGIALLTLSLGGALPTRAAEWQWSVSVPSVVSQETNDHPRAFLWIPPNCAHVQGVVVGQHNMLEEGILEHAAFRKTLTDLSLAEIWISPGLNLVFDFNKGAGDSFNDMMAALAKESGYQELNFAPIVPLGHSAAASYPWNFAAWNPGRTLAVLSVHGDAPLTNRTGSGKPNPDWGTRNLDGIPGLMVMGEYEWADDRLEPAMDYRAKHPNTPLAFLGDAGHGHFDFSDQLVDYLGLFLRKVVAQRLPADAPLDRPVILKPIDPHQGWLVDHWRHDAPLQAPAAPFDQYTGNPREAFWCFDGEMARATEDYYKLSRGKLPQYVDFVQDSQNLPQTGGLAQINVRFLPLEDGVSFHLSGVFLDTAPAGNRAGLPVGTPVGHAEGGGPVVITRICGPVAQTGPDTFSIRFYRMGMNSPRRSNEIWLLASHPGDERYKSTVQQASLHFPLTNTNGADQTITFPTIPDQIQGAAPIPLSATSDAKVPVYYYVREGPAEIAGNTLTFTKIPPRSQFPVKVTVVAWQWGRSIEPKLKTAPPVEQTFSIIK